MLADRPLLAGTGGRGLAVCCCDNAADDAGVEDRGPLLLVVLESGAAMLEELCSVLTCSAICC